MPMRRVPSTNDDVHRRANRNDRPCLRLLVNDEAILIEGTQFYSDLPNPQTNGCKFAESGRQPAVLGP